MLIYHITNNTLYVTEVMIGSIKSSVNKFKVKNIPEKHVKNISELRNNGLVYVTGGTYASANYDGKFEPRKMFRGYL